MTNRLLWTILVFDMKDGNFEISLLTLWTLFYNTTNIKEIKIG
jgi:hypothetical protein